MYALRSRLIIAATLVLAVFLGVTGLALDQIFQAAARAQINDRLQSRIYALLAAAEINHDVLTLPRSLPDPNYSVPGSGLYARIDREDLKPLWKSRSMLGIRIEFPGAPEPGQAVFSQSPIRRDDAPANSTDGVFALSYRIRWELNKTGSRDYILHVAESRTTFAQRLTDFRHSLFLWLTGASLMLLAVQGLILAWSLRPLRKLAQELAEIEQGTREYLSERQPTELQPLVLNLNHLIRTGRRQLERHRNALADLAHSLKNPLSILINSATQESTLETLKNTVRDTVARMDDSLSSQLRKAAVGGADVLAAPTPLQPILERLRSSLLKVHFDRNLSITIDMQADLEFCADSDDLMEICGNLIDNACKWAQQQIDVRIRKDDSQPKACLVIEVEDDGPGIPESERQYILQRGGRLDEHTPGHGLGLAIVRELVEEHYAGQLTVGNGANGGACLEVRLFSGR